MIVLGYPGKSARNNATRAIWGAISTVPFAYIVYKLFVGPGQAFERQDHRVRSLIEKARLLTFASWGFYPIGYTIADMVTKAVVGILIYVIAVRKSTLESDIPVEHQTAKEAFPI